MRSSLEGVRLLVLGGDKREIEMVRHLATTGAEIFTVGHPSYPESPNVVRAESFTDISELLPEIDAVIAPMSNTDENGQVRAVPEKGIIIRLDDELFRRLRPLTPLFIGMARPVVRDAAERHGIRLIEMAEDDEIAILNSIPTAEGAIQIAMEELPITLHGARALVLGFGRCGLTLARMLDGMGARVCVVARNPAQLARAREMGLDVAHLQALAEVAKTADVVFNTAPTLLLTRAVLQEMRHTTLIVDIASAPGGVDYPAAAEAGIKAILALGLPGKVAPVTAGRILGKCLPRMIRAALSETSLPAGS